MIKKQQFPFFLFILLLFTSCHPDNKFSISGNLPDTSYDGEYIYLVPMKDATKNNVDSALIKNGTFYFSGIIDTTEICIIRTRQLLRLKLEELLIAKEPGTIRIDMGPTSSASGTLLNDSLQSWKQQQMMYDNLFRELRKQYTSANDSLMRSKIKLKADALNDQRNYSDYIFVKNNVSNVVGKMVYNLRKTSFSEKQRDTLGLQ